MMGDDRVVITTRPLVVLLFYCSEEDRPVATVSAWSKPITWYHREENGNDRSRVRGVGTITCRRGTS